MRALNFSRAVLKDKTILGRGMPHGLDILEGLKKGVKFILPPGGRVMDDALANMPDHLNLPFPTTVLEYEWRGVGSVPDSISERIQDTTVDSPKRIAIATQVNDKAFDLRVANTVVENGKERWELQFFVARVELSNKADESIHNVSALFPETAGMGLTKAAELGLSVRFTHATQEYDSRQESEWIRQAYGNMNDEIRSMLELLEVLSCSNVKQGIIRADKEKNKNLPKGTLKFDDYRVLMIESGSEKKGTEQIGEYGSRHSPREHIRRGHIRRYSDGRKIWIQSMVVNAGAAGKIHKVYSA